MPRTLTYAQAKQFYDRFGARQDRGAWYEDQAIGFLLEHGAFDSARSIFELGFGTGRLAHRLLSDTLPADARYVGVDLSDTMTSLARQRLAAFGDRAEARTSSGPTRTEDPVGSCDRFLSAYVLDLLADADIDAALAEAHRVLVPGGKLCLVSLTSGATFGAKVVTALWRVVHRIHPRLVGGCRPVRLIDRLDRSRWSVDAHTVVTARGVLSSEALVATRR